MLRRTYDGQRCTIARALEVVGERWTILIVRDALLGVTRFDGFLSSLRIARNVLARRLNDLVTNGILERVAYQERPIRYEYRLTPRGHDLAPVVVAMMEWGDRNFADESGPPRKAVHVGCGGHAGSQVLCESCQRPLLSHEITAVWTGGRSQ
jgi:DNA-binding HxlR family transcriptional regulator